MYSNTILVQKKPKPTPADQRPIALINESYKIFMGVLRVKMEKHLRNA